MIDVTPTTKTANRVMLLCGLLALLVIVCFFAGCQSGFEWTSPSSWFSGPASEVAGDEPGKPAANGVETTLRTVGYALMVGGILMLALRSVFPIAPLTANLWPIGLGMMCIWVAEWVPTIKIILTVGAIVYVVSWIWGLIDNKKQHDADPASPLLKLPRFLMRKITGTSQEPSSPSP